MTRAVMMRLSSTSDTPPRGPALAGLLGREMSAPCAVDGLCPATRLRTPEGFRAIGALAPGDRVVTFRHGAIAITEVIDRPTAPCLTLAQPAWNAAGTLAGLRVAPDQRVTVAADRLARLYGQRVCLIAAREMVRAGYGCASAQPIRARSLSLGIPAEVGTEGGRRIALGSGCHADTGGRLVIDAGDLARAGLLAVSARGLARAG